MKILVLGSTGLIGSRVARMLEEGNHDVVRGSSKTVNLLTGEGLSEALQDIQVVIDLTNSPSFEDSAALNFFRTSARSLFPAESAADIQHHLALSVVGAERMVNLGYMRAKVAQENAIETAGIPYTIVRATQFFEFIGGLVDAATEGQNVRVSDLPMQPLAADDIARAIAAIALQPPRNGIVNVAGPMRRHFDDFAREFLQARHDTRVVLTDPSAGYFGAQVPDNALVPDHDEVVTTTRFSDWLIATQKEVQTLHN